MPRHHPILVHKQISAQLQAGLLKQPPRAYPALVNYPPNPTPTQDPYSNPKHKNLQAIKFTIRDRLRRAFFRDHPFEAYRPISLVEESPQQVISKLHHDLSSCDRLDQISCKPSAEDCIAFAETLYSNKGYNLNQAYKIAVSELRTLRFEDQIRASFARQEAEYYHHESTLGENEEASEPKNQKKNATPWGRDLVKRSIEIQDRFITTSNQKAKNPIHLESPVQRATTLATPSKPVEIQPARANRLIGSRVKNSNHLNIQEPNKFNLFINSEIIRKSKRLSSIYLSTKHVD